MIAATQLKVGMVIMHNGKPHRVTNVLHVTPGNWRGMVQTRLVNIESGSNAEHRFRSEDKVVRAPLEEHNLQYSYRAADDFHFMNTETYEMMSLGKDVLGDAVYYLIEGMEIQALYFEGRVVGIDIPFFVRAAWLREGYDATRADMRASFEKLVEIVRVMHEKGVPIVAGTDGYPMDLIREMVLYVRAGMTNGEALETATDGAARALGLGDKVGSIAAGQTADLVLVVGDVEASIGALRRVVTVMQGGKLMNGADLREAAGFSGAPE